MVKNKKSANRSDSSYIYTDTPREKNNTLVFDNNLSPLVCRKLIFENKNYYNFKDHIPKKIISHQKIKNLLHFDVEWESSFLGYQLSSNISLLSAKKNCPELLIDYLITKL